MKGGEVKVALRMLGMQVGRMYLGSSETTGWWSQGVTGWIRNQGVCVWTRVSVRSASQVDLCSSQLSRLGSNLLDWLVCGCCSGICYLASGFGSRNGNLHVAVNYSEPRGATQGTLHVHEQRTLPSFFSTGLFFLKCWPWRCWRLAEMPDSGLSQLPVKVASVYLTEGCHLHRKVLLRVWLIPKWL